MSVPLSRILSPRTITLLSLRDDMSYERLTETYERYETRLNALQRQENIHRDNWSMLRHLRRRIEPLESALTELYGFLNPSYVGGTFGGPGYDPTFESYGVLPCNAADCRETVTRQESYQQAGYCIRHFKIGSGVDPDSAIYQPLDERL